MNPWNPKATSPPLRVRLPEKHFLGLANGKSPSSAGGPVIIDEFDEVLHFRVYDLGLSRGSRIISLRFGLPWLGGHHR